MGKIYKYTNIVLETIQRNNRKINAIIRRSKIHRIKVYIMLMSMILTVINPIYAIENKSTKVYCRIDPKMYIRYYGNPQPNYEYFYYNNGEELPAYCVNLGMKGAEEEKDGYLVNTNSNISDYILKSIVLNCYPYKTIQELGLTTREEAKFASQFAIWIYTANLNIDYIQPILNENQNVVEAIKNIYYSGINNQKKSIELNSSEQNVELINNEYYYTKIISANPIENIEISTNQKQVLIQKLDNAYKVCVPVNIVDKLYNLELSIRNKEKVVLYGNSTKEGYQDVVLTAKEILGEISTYRVTFENMKKVVNIIKKDKETKEPLKGVKYRIQNDHYGSIGDYETDENGKIQLELLDIKGIFITEIKTLDGYVLDNNTYSLELKENELNILELYNIKKKGNIRIVKKTKEYNEITGFDENTPLKNVSFYIYDEDMNLVDDITTDEYGLATSKKIPTGKYYIKEYETHEYYEILDQIIEVEIINQDEIVNVEILNNNVNIPKKLPITGR
ncbi:MAG: Cys-Gln thioester bond-forming surface protein [Clostridia bacterium]|nr:Cys-Gln thioester bond-forming surface protein [Clostridia bacterium]